ncbi:MAG: 1-pyrroline-5-carboxylate dehydrogenase, partial [Gemmatimonadetes bacterium]|nr:1-pyrroline-5-carboxylate dehydrogenase [Gemmatimonadota bacterium]
MSSTVRVPFPTNEPVFEYGPGSPEKSDLKVRLEELASSEIEVPVIIGGKEIRTGDTEDIRAPHDHSLKLGTWHKAG